MDRRDDSSSMSSLLRAAALYAVVAWLLVQIGEAYLEPMALRPLRARSLR